MRPAKPRKPREVKRYRLEVDSTLPPISQAVSIWLAILAFAHVTNSTELARIPDELELSDEQRSLLVEHRPVLGLVGGPRPVISISCCPQCGRWSLSATGAGSTGCRLTLGCTGKPRRAVAAKKQLMEKPLSLVVNNVGSQTDPPVNPPSDPSDTAPADLLEPDHDSPVFVDFGDEYVNEGVGEDISEDFPL